MNDPFDARTELGQWFQQMLNEIDRDRLGDGAAIENLKGRIAGAFAEWRLDTGFGMLGLPVEPPPGED